MSKEDVQALHEIVRMNNYMKRLHLGIKSLRDSQTGMGLLISEKVQSSPKDTMSETIADIVDLESEYNEHRQILTEMRNRLMIKIDQLDGVSQTILTERYINGLEWNKVSYFLGYSLRHIMRLNKNAVELLEAI